MFSPEKGSIISLVNAIEKSRENFQEKMSRTANGEKNVWIDFFYSSAYCIQIHIDYFELEYEEKIAVISV